MNTEEYIYIYIHRFFWMGCSQQPDKACGLFDASRASDPWADRGRSGLHRGIGLFEGSAASMGVPVDPQLMYGKLW